MEKGKIRITLDYYMNHLSYYLQKAKRREQKCLDCGKEYTPGDHLRICPSCNYRPPLIQWFLDLTGREISKEDVLFNNKLAGEIIRRNKDTIKSNHPRYKQKIRASKRLTWFRDGLFVLKTKIGNHPIILTILNPEFFNGAIGPVEAGKLVYAFKMAERENIPIIGIWINSAGMNMNIDMNALRAMPYISGIRKSLTIPYISVIAGNIYGGTSVSLAQGHITIALEGSKLGFTGPGIFKRLLRVTKKKTQELVEKYLKTKYQGTSEMRTYSKVDMIVTPDQLRNRLLNILNVLDIKNITSCNVCYFEEPLIIGKLKDKVYPNNHQVKNPTEITPLEIFRIANSDFRPTFQDYLNGLFDSFIELRRVNWFLGIDHTLIGGLAIFQGIPVMVMGTEKGKLIEEENHYYLNQRTYFRNGMIGPTDCGKAIRLVKLAEKFKLPVLMFVDTLGARFDFRAENYHMFGLLDQVMQEVPNVKTWIISINIGRGGSGGYIALACGGDIVIMQEYAYAATADPSAKTILYKDLPNALELAANNSEMTAQDLLRQGYIDIISKEPPGGAHLNPEYAMQKLRENIRLALEKLLAKSETPTPEDIKIRKDRYKINIPAV